MGYRFRLGKVSKEDHLKTVGKSEDDLKEIFTPDDDYFPSYKPPFYTQIYELGKYCSFPDNLLSKFYDFEMDDCEFHIAGKELLLFCIEEYRKLTYEFIERPLAALKDAAEGKTLEVGQSKELLNMYMTLVSKLREWKNGPYYIDELERDGAITPSWSMEYAIFNLVYIYKTFDWENDLLILSAW